jgi:hypothetical protein
MNDQAKKSSIQSLAAGLLGFIGIVGLGSLVMMHHGGAAVKAPVSVYSPVDADPGGPALLRTAHPAPAAPAVASVAAMTSPVPLLPAEAARDDASAVAAAGVAAPGAAQPSAAPALPAAKLAAAARVDMSGSASTSASATAVTAAPKLKNAPARKPYLAPKLDLAKNAGGVASTVHYGVSDRSELMGRAAGPVYNFSGGGAKQGARVAADNMAASGALQQVDAAEKQLDASDAPDADKAKLHRDLDRVRATAAQSSQP